MSSPPTPVFGGTVRGLRGRGNVGAAAADAGYAAGDGDGGNPRTGRPDRGPPGHQVVGLPAVLELRGERSVPRLAYLDGDLEILIPSRSHELLKSVMGRLVEAWCLERGLEFTPCGCWTLEDKWERRGV